MLGFDRITFDPNVMGGRACIRGMRVTVAFVVNLVANGMTMAEICEAYPYLEPRCAPIAAIRRLSRIGGTLLRGEQMPRIC
jgi:hypothetical protein